MVRELYFRDLNLSLKVDIIIRVLTIRSPSPNEISLQSSSKLIGEKIYNYIKKITPTIKIEK